MKKYDSEMEFSHGFPKVIPVIIFLAFTLFLNGFFPMKHSLPGFAKKNNTQDGEISQPNKLFDKVVVILIDALRSDFVFERNLMPLLKAKIDSGSSRHFTLRAHPPTVTLPRIKAITTGSIPGFIDMVLNFQSSEMHGDNIITQAYRDERRIVFYGDDTWIKLFPNHFTDSDGTTSFFVTDYTEVDDNVTRHIDERLSALDWDLMILHYLGLDHIGHTAGPNSPLVPTKLAEMDKIVDDMYNTLEKKGEDFVILICGDHGMSDQGSHGGASDREVFVPAVFISPKYQQTETRWRSSRELLQIDLAPTLSMLMGLPIPINNLGQGLVGVMDGYTDTDKLNLLSVNCQQVLQLMEQNVPDLTAERSYDLYTHAVHLHENYVTKADSHKPDVSMVIRAYETAMGAMATKISKSLTTYDMYAMMMAVIILFLCLIKVTLSTLRVTDHQFHSGAVPVFLLVGVAVFGHVTVCTSQSHSSSALCGRSPFSFGGVSLVWLTIVYLVVMIMKSLQGWRRKRNVSTCMKALLLFGTVTHSLSFLSSSFVEEEHQTWYFLSMTFYLVVIIHTITKNVTERYYKTGTDSSTEVTICTAKVGNTSDEKTGERYDKYEENISDSGQRLRERFKTEPSEKRQCQDYDALGKQIDSPNGNMKEGQMISSQVKVKWTLLPWRQILSMLTVMCIGRCLRSINQTGNKWLDTPDLGDWLIRPDNEGILSYTTVVCILVIGLTKVRDVSVRTVLFVLGLAGCYCYRISTGVIHNVLMVPGFKERSKGISEAWFVYGMILLINFSTIIKLIWNMSYKSTVKFSVTEKTKFLQETIETVQLSWILLITLLLRPHNVIFVAMVILQEQLLWKQCITKLSLPVWCQTLICWWIGQTSFFQQGNSNSISTVDVSAGYVGLQEFNSVPVACLMYCSSYAGPIFWFITLLKSLVYHAVSQQHNQSTEENENIAFSKRFQTGLSECIQTLSLERVFTLCVYCTMVTVERYHLFVWTVFSPKLIYEGMLTLTYVIFTTVLGLMQLVM